MRAHCCSWQRPGQAWTTFAETCPAATALCASRARGRCLRRFARSNKPRMLPTASRIRQPVSRTPRSGQSRPRTLREAIVNGLAHRDWLTARPTVIEHIGDTLTVTSPGGFVGGVTPTNIITHPAVPRHRNLSEAMAALGLAEREGIGVDRMVRDMLAIGRPMPVIAEVEGPYVRVVLLGGSPDTAVVNLVAALSPAWTGNVDSLLLIEHLTRHGWVDAESGTGLLQRSSSEETDEAIHRLAEAGIDDAGSAPVIAPVRGVPPQQAKAFRLSDVVRGRLAHRLAPLRTREGRGSADSRLGTGAGACLIHRGSGPDRDKQCLGPPPAIRSARC